MKHVHIFLAAALFTTNVVHATSLINKEIYFLSRTPGKTRHPLFKKVASPLHDLRIATDPHTLLKAAEDALHHLLSSKGMGEYDDVVRNNYPRLAQTPNFSVTDLFSNGARKTLQFLIWSLRNDRNNKRPARILDPAFLNEHFDFIEWKPDKASAARNKVDLPGTGHIRTTKYAVFKAQGSRVKTKKFSCALYTFADDKQADTIRFKFTKQDVVGGALEKQPFASKVRPLVWLTRDGLEDALMQGTISVQFPNNQQTLFTVDKNNGIAYDRKIKNPRKQRRYWYFKEIDLTNDSSQACVLKHPDGVALAGDVYNLGLGKLIALEHINVVNRQKEMRLGVLIDTGGAFTNNLYQVDQFAGIFDTKQKMYDKTPHLPRFAKAYILVKKS